MSFHPTENSEPSATARSGVPSGATRSSPWCHLPWTSARKAPKVLPKAAVPKTGNT